MILKTHLFLLFLGELLLYRNLGRLLAQIPRRSFLSGQTSIFWVFHSLSYCRIHCVLNPWGQKSEFWPQGKTEGDFGLSRVNFRYSLYYGNAYEMDRIRFVGLLYVILDRSWFYNRRNFMDRYRCERFRSNISKIYANFESLTSVESDLPLGINESSR